MIDGTRKYLSVHILYTKESLGKNNQSGNNLTLAEFTCLNYFVFHIQIQWNEMKKWKTTKFF